MEHFLTKNRDTENYLVLFFDVGSVFNYALLSTGHYCLVKIHPLYQQLLLYKRTYTNYNNLVDWASEYGQLIILDWYKNSGLKFNYGRLPIDCASKNGHIHILEWFKNFGLEFKHLERP